MFFCYFSFLTYPKKSLILSICQLLYIYIHIYTYTWIYVYTWYSPSVNSSYSLQVCLLLPDGAWKGIFFRVFNASKFVSGHSLGFAQQYQESKASKHHAWITSDNLRSNKHQSSLALSWLQWETKILMSQQVIESQREYQSFDDGPQLRGGNSIFLKTLRWGRTTTGEPTQAILPM